MQRIMGSIMDNIEVTIKDIDIDVSNLLGLCVVHFQLDSFEITNDSTTKLKMFKLTQMSAKVGIADDPELLML